MSSRPSAFRGQVPGKGTGQASRPAPRRSSGFTLIEVLLAMTILAGIMTVVYAAFSTAGRSVEQAEQVRDDTDLARSLVARLSHDIANAYVKDVPYRLFLGTREETEINGEPRRFDGLALTTLTNWRRPGSKEMELWEVGYRFTEKADGTGRVLVRREKRDLGAGTAPLEGGEEYELTDRVAELRLRYHDGGAQWLDEWSRRTVAPKRVEITLRLDSGRLSVTEVEVANQ